MIPELVSIDDFPGQIVELPAVPNLEQAFLRLSRRPHGLFLDSARRDVNLGRFSFLTADPFEFIALSNLEAARALNGRSPSPFALVQSRLSACRSATVAGLPPFQGGAAGLFGYDLLHSLENIPRPRFDDLPFPALAVGLYDVVLAIDHFADRAWIISQGWPEADLARRRRRAALRLEQFQAWLAAPPSTLPASPAALTQRLAPQFPVSGHQSLTSNFSPAAYLEAVAAAIEYVRAGDIFQVNLAQRLLHPALDDSPALYLRLRSRNPATFAGYFDLGPQQIASASPERFLWVAGDAVEARPIKGTRRRIDSPEADLFAGDDLLESQKDRAENIMIVDLLRNDLSRVCDQDSIQVAELCRLETYQFVQHLVSVVRGRLRPDQGPLDLLKAAFPGGSITGAPKVRAMQIISELEPTARGAYCGSLAYVGFDGRMDANILIRTILAGHGYWQMPVGGGITAQSDPSHEYRETWHKAEGLLRALE